MDVMEAYLSDPTLATDFEAWHHCIHRRNPPNSNGEASPRPTSIPSSLSYVSKGDAGPS